MKLAAIRQRKKPAISLTPLIDVVFILLVFFMLASSFLDWRVISLRTAKLGQAGPASQGAVLVKVMAEGEFQFSGDRLNETELASRISAFAAREKKPRVMVEAEKGVELQNVVDLVDLIAASGLEDVTLATRAETQ